MRVEVSSPTRVDFAGGTLDCWPLYDFVDGAVTVNLSIDILTSVTLEKRSDQAIEIVLGEDTHTFASLESLLQSKDPQLLLLQNHLRYWQPPYGFRIETKSQSPVGGGLGGSSSLSISLIKAFSALEKKPLSEIAMVTLASNIEARLLNTPTGTQDYFPAVTPGLRCIHYKMSGPECEIIDVNLQGLKERMFLVYTGKPHHSGLNNWSVIKKAVERDENTLTHLKALKRIAEHVYRECSQQNWDALTELFKQEYEHRVALAPEFSSKEIERLNEMCLRNGAEAVKICGAGGGGCVMVWSKPEQRPQLMSLCQESGFTVFDVSPVGIQ